MSGHQCKAARDRLRCAHKNTCLKGCVACLRQGDNRAYKCPNYRENAPGHSASRQSLRPSLSSCVTSYSYHRLHRSLTPRVADTDVRALRAYTRTEGQGLPKLAAQQPRDVGTLNTTPTRARLPVLRAHSS